jgi:molybdopterin converting factor small subunit
MTNVYVSLLGNLAEIAGSDFFVLKNMNDTSTLLRSLYVNFPQLKEVHFKMFLKHKIVNKNFKLKNGDEIALIIPNC